MSPGESVSGVEQSSRIRGSDIAWSSFGDGPVALYAHGLTQSRAAEDAAGLFDWSPVSAAGRRLVRYDARGHGRSSGTATPTDYQWSNLALDLLTLADELSPDAPVAGIGSSMGTGTLLHAAVRSPARFDRLVLTAPPTAWATRAGQGDLYRGGADLVEQRGLAAMTALTAAAPIPAPFSDLGNFPPPPDVAEALLPSVLRGAAGSDLPDPDAIAALELPVLILAWADDPGHPLSTAERLADLITGSRLEVAETSAQLRQWGSVTAQFLAV
jgi:3-oxoadipate enol-lactonase